MKVRDMVLVSLFTSLTAIGAFISIPLGPVYVTLQSFFVIFSGMILGPRLGALSQLLYLLLGLVGIPIFTGFTGGLQAIYKPSFGFIVGFIFASFCAGKLYFNSDKKLPYKTFLVPILSSLVIYIFGLPYMYFALNILGNSNVSIGFVLKFGFFLFLPGDLIKIIILSIVSKKVLPLLK